MRTSLCGHDVPAKDVLIEDVLDGDFLGRDVLVLGGDIMSTQGHPRADVPVEDIYVCFYFCPFVVKYRVRQELLSYQKVTENTSIVGKPFIQFFGLSSILYS